MLVKRTLTTTLCNRTTTVPHLRRGFPDTHYVQGESPQIDGFIESSRYEYQAAMPVLVGVSVCIASRINFDRLCSVAP